MSLVSFGSSTVPRPDLSSAGVSWASSTDLAEWSVLELRQLFHRHRVGLLLGWGSFRDCSAGLLIADGVSAVAYTAG